MNRTAWSSGRGHLCSAPASSSIYHLRCSRVSPLTARGRRIPDLAALVTVLVTSVILGSVATGLGIDWLGTTFAVLFLIVAFATGALLLKWLIVGLAGAGSAAERRRVERRRPTPYVFNPPPGWPVPDADWVPPSGWQPQPTWPPMPERWELWQRLTPRPAPPPPPRRTVWEAQDSDARSYLMSFDEAQLFSRAGTPQGRQGLSVEALQWQALALQQRIEFDAEHQAGERGRSRWHPLEWAFRRASDALTETASAVTDRLIEDAPLNPDDLVALWRAMLAWGDELLDAAAEQAGVDRYAVLSGAQGAAAGSSSRNDLRLPGEPWQQAEALAAAALRKFGFDDARVTGSGADRGLDVVGSGVAAQVKYTATAVGRPTVQQLLGAAGGRQAVFFSRAGYTQHAVEEADARGMALFRIALPSSVTAMNTTARRMATR